MGFFFATISFIIKYQELKAALEETMNSKFSNNSNSFNSCFQYMEFAANDRPYRRIKIYGKGLQLLQSQSP